MKESVRENGLVQRKKGRLARMRIELPFYIISAASPERSCSGALAHWDAHPEVPFVRDTRSHEHGYKGFPFIENKEKPVLTYPKE